MGPGLAFDHSLINREFLQWLIQLQALSLDVEFHGWNTAIFGALCQYTATSYELIEFIRVYPYPFSII